jgi:hypothetical protein
MTPEQKGKKNIGTEGEGRGRDNVGSWSLGEKEGVLRVRYLLLDGTLVRQIRILVELW